MFKSIQNNFNGDPYSMENGGMVNIPRLTNARTDQVWPKYRWIRGAVLSNASKGIRRITEEGRECGNGSINIFPLHTFVDSIELAGILYSKHSKFIFQTISCMKKWWKFFVLILVLSIMSFEMIAVVIILNLARLNLDQLGVSLRYETTSQWR